MGAGFDDRIAARLIVLLVMAPIMLGWVADSDLAGVAPDTASQIELTEPLQLLWLALGPVAGFALAQRPPVPSALAQIVPGSGIGLRFDGYRRRVTGSGSWSSPRRCRWRCDSRRSAAKLKAQVFLRSYAR